MATKTDKASAMVRFTAEVTIEERYDPEEIIQAAIEHRRDGCEYDWCDDLSGAVRCVVGDRMNIDAGSDLEVDWPRSFDKLIAAAEAELGEEPEFAEQLAALDPNSPTVYAEVADILRAHFGSSIDMDKAVQKHVNDLKYNTQRKAS